MNHKKEIRLKLVTILFFCLCGVGAVIGTVCREQDGQMDWYELPEQKSVEQEEPSLAAEPSGGEKAESGLSGDVPLEEALLYVHVCGAVVKEGVYALPVGSRGVDALEAAGGFLPEAATSYCNLAEVLTDGLRLYIPTEEEAAGSLLVGEESREQENARPVNINQADKETLMTLPGIGASKAENILKYRSRTGKFQTLEELMNVSGIGQALFEGLRDKITL